MEGRQGWLTWGSSLWANVSFTGSCSPEMLPSPTVMPTTVLSKTCAVWLASCGEETLQELSWWVVSAGGSMKGAGNASPYLEHVKLLDIEDCHHHRHCFATQGPEYPPGEVDFTCLPFPCAVQLAGALRQRRTVRARCCWVTSLFRTHQSCSRHKFSAQVGLLSNISRSPEGRREEPHPQHPASMGAELGVGPSRFSTHHHTWSPGTSRAWESLWVGRRHKVTHLSFFPTSHSPRPPGLLGWLLGDGSFLPSTTSCQGMLKQPHREEEEHSKAHQALGQGLRDAWKVWNLTTKGEGGAHLTSVGEKVMRTSRVTALLTFRSNLLSPASCPSCSTLGEEGAVGQVDMGTEPTEPVMATPGPT